MHSTETVVGTALRTEQTRWIKAAQQRLGDLHDRRHSDSPALGRSCHQHFGHCLHLLGLRLQPP